MFILYPSRYYFVILGYMLGMDFVLLICPKLNSDQNCFINNSSYLSA